MGQLSGRRSEGRVEGLWLLHRQPGPDRGGSGACGRDHPPRVSVSGDAEDQTRNSGENTVLDNLGYKGIKSSDI